MAAGFDDVKNYWKIAQIKLTRVKFTNVRFQDDSGRVLLFHNQREALYVFYNAGLVFRLDQIEEKS